ncbi:hypothetical protein ACFLZV_04240 [Candidatus Margulisiibacteriota bacterium]
MKLNYHPGTDSYDINFLEKAHLTAKEIVEAGILDHDKNGNIVHNKLNNPDNKIELNDDLNNSIPSRIETLSHP